MKVALNLTLVEVKHVTGGAHRGQCSSNPSVCLSNSAPQCEPQRLFYLCLKPETSLLQSVFFCSFVQPNKVCTTFNKSVQAAFIPPG